MASCDLAQHEAIRSFIGEIVRGHPGGPVGGGALGRVLERVALASPAAVPQIDIAAGTMLAQPKALSIATVARAVSALEVVGLLEREEARSDRPGRPVVPIRLGTTRWVVAGLHASYAAGQVNELAGELFTLDLTERICQRRAQLPPGGLPITELAELAAGLVLGLVEDIDHLSVSLLGVGLEIGEQVYRDQVVVMQNGAPTFADVGRSLSLKLSPTLKQLAPNGVAVVVENDANARAIERSYRFGHPSFSLVAVFDHGVGGALVNQNKLIRGATGGAGEIGHVAVEYESTEGAPGFDDPCSCGQRGHVDAVATPARILQAIDSTDLAASSASPMLEGLGLTPTAAAFHRAGRGLGRGLTTLLNLTNPGRFHLLLPPELGAAPAGTAGSAYLAAVEAEVNRASTTVAADARNGGERLNVEIIDPSRIAAEGSRAAASCVLRALTDHARERETCSIATAHRPTADSHL
jgi:predicted NBD/HSP70 family sugar kinase